jgi:hypothetical protein
MDASDEQYRLILEMVVPFLLGDDSQESTDRAAQWMYMTHGAKAYAGFLKDGRGVLMGPFATGSDGLLLQRDKLKTVVDAGEPFVLTVTYIAADQDVFRKVIPESNYREQMLPGLETYDPEREVAILLLIDGNPSRFLPGYADLDVSPRDLYDCAPARKEPVN